MIFAAATLVFILGATPAGWTAERSLASVAELRVRDTRTGKEWGGSAVVIDRNRILTNFHVISAIEDSMFIIAELVLDGQVIPLNPRLIKDDKCDLAIGFPTVSISRPKLELKQATLGERVVAIGNFAGKGVSRLAGGYVSRRNRQAYFLKLEDGEDCQIVQYSATGIPGGSGGALYSLDGKLTALLYAREPRAFGIGYAIDSSEIRRFLSGHAQ
jgi:S1-C subfamily serine protease